MKMTAKGRLQSSFVVFTVFFLLWELCLRSWLTVFLGLSSSHIQNKEAFAISAKQYRKDSQKPNETQCKVKMQILTAEKLKFTYLSVYLIEN